METKKTSEDKYVCYDKVTKVWAAFIECNGKKRFLGSFDSEEEAKYRVRRAVYILGFHNDDKEDISSYNVGKSNYSEFLIQPWQIMMDYDKKNYWDEDILKRILRTKNEEGMSFAQSRRLDYEKIIHICKERIRQIDEGVDPLVFLETMQGLSKKKIK